MLHHVDGVGQFAMTVNPPRDRHKPDLRDLYIADNVPQPFLAGHQLKKRTGRP